MSASTGLPTDFRIAVSFTETQVVIGLSGELDPLSAAELEAMFDTMFDRGHDTLVLDLTELAYMDGLGFRVMANAARRLQSLRGTLTLRSPSAVVRRIFDNNGLASLVQFELGDADRSRLGPEQGVSVEKIATTSERVRADGLVASMPVERALLDDALRLVVNLAKRSVAGADGVSVSLLRDGQIMTVAASDQTVMEMDTDQYSTGEGPCLDATIQGRWFHINSLEEETRWPSFVPMARALGINAILSNPLLAQTKPVGALNIYSRAVAAFGQPEQELASAFASEVSIVLSNVGIGMTDMAHAQRLHSALRSREVIAQAQGIMMERAGIGEQAAFDHLRRFSQQSDRPLRERAEDVVASTRWQQPDIEQVAGDSHE